MSQNILKLLSRKNNEIHGTAILPLKAIAVANENDELISNIISQTVIDKGEYKNGISYKKGDAVFIHKGGRNYYFVARIDNPTAAPPNLTQWVKDQCSKFISGCGIRWGTDGSVVPGESNLIKGQLPYNGFPSVGKSR